MLSAAAAGLSSRSLAIVSFASLILLQLVGVERTLAALPPGAEDEIVLIEHLPGRRVHLQDFFWTGVEDAPSWIDPEQLLTLYETRTVHHTATVYIPEDARRPGSELDISASRPPIDCTSCIDPTPTLLEDVDQDIGVLVGEDPGPRYWLLTVLKTEENVPPKVELRLAKLYKAAFTRQQQRHLGLFPEGVHTRKSPKREVFANNQTSIRMMEGTTDSPQPNETSSSLPSPRSSSESPARERTPSSVSLLRMRAVRFAKSKRTLPILESEEFEELALEPISPEDESSRNESSADKSKRSKSLVDVGLVQVRMQNTSQIEGGATRLIYTVHLGGKPVPAETAAKDMALLSAQEVALELGAPVLIQSEPYLKESRPLALSRKRDAWLLAGATGAGFFLLAVVIVGLLFLTKRKRAQSAVSAPPNRAVLNKDEEYAPTTPGIDNTAYTSETEVRTEATSGHRRTTPGSLSRTPGSQDTTRDVSSENELDNNEQQQRRGQQQHAKPWESREYAEIAKKGAPHIGNGSRYAQRVNAADRSRSPIDSLDSTTGAINGGATRLETLESLEKGFVPTTEEATGSPHSYLSMPSCKQFPNMRTVEPLSKVLEPVVVKHLDLELESPEMKIKDYDFMKTNGDHYFSRGSSATKDPGVLGPIVWDLKRKRAVEGNIASAQAADMEPGRVPHGAVGRARRRLNELLEDSFGLFGARDSRYSRHEQQQQQQQQQQQRQRTYESPGEQRHQDSSGPLRDRFTILAETRGKSAHVSPVSSPNSESRSRPRTSVPRNGVQSEEAIPETGNVGPHPRGAWGSRPLSAGPFHRPNLPEVEVVRVLADSQLRPEDPAVPLIAAIKKELGKFSYD